MKLKLVYFLASAVFLAATVSWAQSGGAPGPAPGGSPADRYGRRYGRPGTPGFPGAPIMPGAPAQPAQPVQPAPIPEGAITFSAVPVNTNFYFVVDTNRVNLWTKISTTSASNTVNSRVAKLPATVLVTTNGLPERPPAESAPNESAPKDRYPRGKMPRPPAVTPPK